MIKITLSILLFTSLTLTAMAQQTNNIKYFDAENKELSEQAFQELRETNKFLDIPGDSINHKKLINREQRGKIEDKAKLISLLEGASKRKFKVSDPIVILFYPGKDPCNSSGNGNSGWYKELERGNTKNTKNRPVYIYKEFDGLEKYNDSLPWIKDPEGIVEKLFFKYHYPCSSFVVISSTGEYISYFGEYLKDFVWQASKSLR